MKKKKIAIVANTSWNIYNFRLGLLDALRSCGFKVIIISPRDEYTIKLKRFGFEYHEIKIKNKGTNLLQEVGLVYNLYKIYKCVSPDVILQYTIKPNIYGSIVAGIIGIPVISNISGLGTVFLKDAFYSKIAKILYKIALRFPRKIFYQNAHDKEIFIKLKLVNSTKTDLLPGSGIDTKTYKPYKMKQDNIFRFLFIARLLKDKGLMEYVDASRKLQHYPNVEFCILGSIYNGNPSSITENEIKNWEKEGFLNFLGKSDDVKSYINQHECIVLPSYREGLSRVLLEAASMAKPIITTNVPGCKEVVDDGINGYLCEVKNSEDLSIKMEKMINLGEMERKAMGKAGRAKVKIEFDEKKVIKKYLEAIDEILIK